MTDISLRPATAEDAAEIAALIRELAVFEKMEEICEVTAADIREQLFGKTPRAHAVLACDGDNVAGFALYFFNFSTFRGRPGLYLEDLFVRPQFRRGGVGQMLLKRLAEIAVAADCRRMEWTVLDWNKDAKNFYHRIGAQPLEEWEIYRLDTDALRALAAG
jgi:GNAT superfamily N-acetyltransferase